MKWIKKGLLHAPDKRKKWSYYYSILPTPLYLKNENKIRIYFGTSSKDRYCGISYIDVAADNPSNILCEHNGYALAYGESGYFDDCGVQPSCIVEIKGQKYLYYLGYQQCQRIPNMCFAGIAKIKDDGTLERIQRVPVLERTNREPYIRSATTILRENGKYRMWYVAAHSWEKLNTSIFHNKLLPNYIIKYAESIDGLNWPKEGKPAIEYRNPDEFGFGRPWVLEDNGIYQMWYSVRRRNIPYRIGYATSFDGLRWKRKDNEVGIDISKTGWDSQMICYPAVIKIKNKTYMFYNGNNNGESGFGYAELGN
jgi:hypothetical protein